MLLPLLPKPNGHIAIDFLKILWPSELQLSFNGFETAVPAGVMADPTQIQMGRRQFMNMELTADDGKVKGAAVERDGQRHGVDVVQKILEIFPLDKKPKGAFLPGGDDGDDAVHVQSRCLNIDVSRLFPMICKYTPTIGADQGRGQETQILRLPGRNALPCHGADGRPMGVETVQFRRRLGANLLPLDNAAVVELLLTAGADAWKMQEGVCVEVADRGLWRG